MDRRRYYNVWIDVDTQRKIGLYMTRHRCFRDQAINDLILAKIGAPVYHPVQVIGAKRSLVGFDAAALETLRRIGPNIGDAFRSLVRRYWE